MPDAPPEQAPNLTSQYASRVATDLERVSTEIATLEERLERLRADRELLTEFQKALHDKSANGASAPLLSTSPAGRAGAAAARERPAAARAASDGRRQRHDITLVDLVRAYLAGQGEPRSAGEITDALATSHPHRSFKTTVVRSTVESLVAKGEAERSKKGTFVYYGAPGTPSGPAKDAPPPS
ncbi:hypothetical protein [Streptomyces sp. NPDC050560]|uniref:hypothetical protein n=1 Tax=Streptomyces sp. NPDC050560 TaxID=3365630 RepID=UPI0037A69596